MSDENNTNIDTTNITNNETVDNSTIENLETVPNVEHEALSKLDPAELVKIIAETRNEAKTRRLKAKTLEEQINTINKEKSEAEQKKLEENQEWQRLFEKQKEDTADYEELKEFKTSYLETCKQEVESSKSSLTKAEMELFELSSKNMTYDEQLNFIKKVVSTRAPVSVIDSTQSTTRNNDDGKTKKKLFPGSGNQDSILDGLKNARKVT